jgi:primosomal protein N' (replication factor Y)
MKAQVLLPKVFNFSFTYNTKKGKIDLRRYCRSTFWKNKEIGVVWPGENFASQDIKIKNINKKISKISLNKNFINFIKWFAMYNVTPLGLVLKMVIGGNKNLFIKNYENFDQRVTTNKKYNLNNEQNKALKFLNLKNNKFDVSVLQGTTGSGKTLVYFERIKKIISEKKQALVLLPEIFLTNEFRSRFYDFFGFEPAIWHSRNYSKK